MEQEKEYKYSTGATFTVRRITNCVVGQSENDCPITFLLVDYLQEFWLMIDKPKNNL